MHYVGMALMGLIVGALAKLLYKGDNSNSWLGSIVLGIAGSYLAGFVASMFDASLATGNLEPAGFLYSLIGAMVLIFVGKRLGFNM